MIIKLVYDIALVKVIETAVTMAASQLFSNKEKFYYFSIITTGEGLAPFVSAWSYEALAYYAKLNKLADNEIDLVKWSYAESPYVDFGSDCFNEVKAQLLKRTPVSYELSEERRNKEFSIRINSMELAIRNLDKRKIFGAGEDRLKIVINVEVMPPTCDNTLRGLRLNPYGIYPLLSEWLKVAEEI